MISTRRLLPLAALFVPTLVIAQTPQTAPPQQTAPRDRPFLGLQTIAAENADRGIDVQYVFPGSAAESMGFRIGDRVLALNDVVLRTREGFINELRGENVGATLRFIIQRDGKKQALRGKIGSYTKTMRAYEKVLQSKQLGKPLPKYPPIEWWDAESMSFKKNPQGLETTGKPAVIFSFDGCPNCRQRRIGKLSAMAQTLEGFGSPAEFRGIYFVPEPDLDKARAAAKKLYSGLKTTIPMGIALYTKESQDVSKRDDHAVLHQHGVAILDEKGTVQYLQVHGLPEQVFWGAFQRILKLETPKAPEKSTAPDAPPGS